MGVDQQIGARWDGLTRVPSYESAFAPTAAAQFLQTQAGPFRYLGYAPLEAARLCRIRSASRTRPTQALLVNNRALALGLEDVQGYNAVHLARFDAYLRELNAGQTQNYHDGQVFAPGLDSPLLDLMGVRYMLVAPDDQSAMNVVYSDPHVRVLERPSVLPRSWLVHDAQVASAADALQLIDSGAVDPRETVLLEQTAVDLAARYVVFGEVAYPGWTAYVEASPCRQSSPTVSSRRCRYRPATTPSSCASSRRRLRAGVAVSMAAFLSFSCVTRLREPVAAQPTTLIVHRRELIKLPRAPAQKRPNVPGWHWHEPTLCQLLDDLQCHAWPSDLSVAIEFMRIRAGSHTGHPSGSIRH